ncbi:hypothetical protein EYC80_005656 [Monilinia laxa]|uniref:Uncharacterized protein n=1 Tax=Monilinia laxa TaxID=61186 RepID=A0A5N6KF45_MONLA|nr:hypothetical protein EYC80_005656 [Monilinia laxa]
MFSAKMENSPASLRLPQSNLDHHPPLIHLIYIQEIQASTTSSIRDAVQRTIIHAHVTYTPSHDPIHFI